MIDAVTQPHRHRTTHRNAASETTDSTDAPTETPAESTSTSTRAEGCPECASDSLVASGDETEIVCEECGLVVEEDQIDPGPEWRAFTHEGREEKSRVGAPTTRTIHDKGLTTTISWQDTDAYGQSLSPEKRGRIRRLRTWQERIRTNNPGERNLQFGLSEIDRMASALGLPDSVEELAAVIYRRAHEADLMRGRSLEGVATAALYAACRKEGIPRSLDEITGVSRVGEVEIGRTYRYVARELGLGMAPTDPTDYLPRFCSALEVSDEVERRAGEILETAAEAGLHSGKSPPGVAGAAIYAASLLCNRENERKTQQEVAEVAHVTEVTIRNRYQEQLEAMDALASRSG